jgi:hypothetical protein
LTYRLRQQTAVLVFAVAATTFAFGATAVAVGASAPAATGAATLYAYVGGQATAPAICPETSAVTDECTLTQALARAGPGTTVALATPGRSGVYVGNWVIGTAGTSDAAPVTIKSATAAGAPVLGGDKGQARGCPTKSCAGPVLTLGRLVHLHLVGLTIRNADNTASGLGGAVQNNRGGSLSVSYCRFLADYANADGGAIDNGDDGGSGTLLVATSLFKGDSAVNSDGGAIANADLGGTGTVVITASQFTANSAINGDGGAVDNGDSHGHGTLRVLASMFVGNVAGRAGAIDNADNGRGTLTVSGTTFSGNVAALDDGGAIDNADWGGEGTLTVSRSTFAGNDTVGDGGGIDNGDSERASRGTATVSTSTFSRNTADVHGGALDNGDYGRGTLVLWASTLSSNAANDIYGAPGQRGGGSVNNGGQGSVWAAADIFDAPCRMSGGRWHDGGYNVGTDSSCLHRASGDVGSGANKLSRLADHGGPTKTEVPTTGNPAIGAIPYGTRVHLGHSTLALCPAADQRGSRSRAQQRCDAGAVQP